MSIRVMSLVWDSDGLGPYDRLVLLSLADHANDDGECYPSISRICKRTGMKERGVQNVIRRLIDRGFVSVKMNGGRKGSNLYTIHHTPAPDAPRIECTPAPDAPHPRTTCGGTPAPGAPKPSMNHQEPSDLETPEDVLCHFASKGAVSSFTAYRRKTKAKALTLTAAKRLAGNLKAILDAGGDPDDALGMAEERGWQTVKPEWYFKEMGNGNGSSNSQNRRVGGGGHSSALDAIALAARDR